MPLTKLRRLKRAGQRNLSFSHIHLSGKAESLAIEYVMKSAFVLKRHNRLLTLYIKIGDVDLYRYRPLSALFSLSLSLCCLASFQMHNPHLFFSLLSQIITPPFLPESLEAPSCSKGHSVCPGKKGFRSALSRSVFSL